jgi:hypothetical protein
MLIENLKNLADNVINIMSVVTFVITNYFFNMKMKCFCKDIL